MAFKNNVMIVRHSLLARLVKLWAQNELVEKIDRLPIELSPKNARVFGRCCIHKERAVWKYKSLPLLGCDMSDEKDELTPLSHYAKLALSGEHKKDNIMCVIDEACSSCIQINYEVTNLCRGCVARSCYLNCPKGAISFNKHGQAEIDHDVCVSCGICHKNCQYHAIAYIPIPCEEACPVGAISKDQFNIEHIDESKCIYCGKCLNACPFGAIFEISDAITLLETMRKGEKVIAIVAPAILSQFGAKAEEIYGAIKQIGFHDVFEVALGATVTTEKESEELLERMHEGQKFMTTSCCPSYMQLVEKHLPDMKKYVSTTKSPMYYTAEIVKEKYPDCKIAFVGPCIAKRKEVKETPNVDYTVTFEEIGSIFEGLNINVESALPFKIATNSRFDSHGFAKTGGVFNAVKIALEEKGEAPIQASIISNLHKKNVNLLKAYAKTGKCPSQFIEVMACENGCISGPCTYTEKGLALRLFDQELAKREKGNKAE